MRRLALVVALALALLVPAAAQTRSQATLVIKVTSVSVTQKATDAKPKGPSKGDKVVFHDNLLNAAAQFGKPKGAKVGSDRGTMTFTSAHSAKFLGVATLPGGTLTLKGQVYRAPDGKGIVIPVTAGTGRFQGAHGVVLVGPGTKRSLNTYTLTLPSGPVA